MRKSYVAPKQAPVALPASDALEAAQKVIGQWHLHWYQVLYFSQPRLTEPGEGRGRPFNLTASAQHRYCLKVEVQPWGQKREDVEHFDFLIRPGDTDEKVLATCQMILEAIRNPKPKVHQLACCHLATHKGCVCAYAFDCPLHGERHIGTHD